MEDLKAPEAPVVETPKATEGELLIDNKREAIEKLVQGSSESETEAKPEVTSDVPKEETKEDDKAEDSDSIAKIAKMKQSVQKRIDKVVAEKKSVEEELAETKAELERLKNSKGNETSNEVVKETPKDSKSPTPEQVEAYIVKMREEGNTKEEITAMRYLIQLEKENALKEINEAETKKKQATDNVKEKQLKDWTELQRDYIHYDDSGKIDPNNDLTLANDKGLLYKTALSLFNDKELHKDFYNDEDVIRGFRRAVSDAYREIHRQGLLKTPKEIVREKPKKEFLADPDAESFEETSQSNTNLLSDAEKVREEFKSRNKNRYLRKIPQN